MKRLERKRPVIAITDTMAWVDQKLFSLAGEGIVFLYESNRGLDWKLLWIKFESEYHDHDHGTEARNYGCLPARSANSVAASLLTIVIPRPYPVSG